MRAKQNNNYISILQRLYNWITYKILKAGRGRVQKRFLIAMFPSHVCDLDSKKIEGVIPSEWNLKECKTNHTNII